MPELTPFLPLRAPRTFTSRSDYRQQLKNYQGRAVQAAREENGGTVTAAEARAIRDRVFAKFITAHGSINAVPALDPNAQGGLVAVHVTLKPAATPAAQEDRPLYTHGVPRRVPTPPAPKPEAPAQAQDWDRDAVPAGARAVVQCIKGCGRWIAAKPGRPVARECPAHGRRRAGLSPDLADVEDLAEATA